MKTKENYIWYELFLTRGLGPKKLNSFYRFLKDNGNQLEGLENYKITSPGSISSIADIYLQYSSLFDEGKIQIDYMELINRGIKIITLDDKEYPALLRKRMKDSSPPVLFCEGNISLLNAEGYSIVGSRNASKEGVKFAQKLAGELALEGKNVISGYAKGIDTNAHLGALEKDGTTSIVLSYGINHFSKKTLFKNTNWENNYLVLSQFKPNEKWFARNAMIRNELICNLAKAVIIIESGPEIDENGKQSGSFAEGKSALKNNIPLFVVEPSYFKKAPLGNQPLINLGAKIFKPSDGVKSILNNIKSVKEDKQESLFD